MWQKLADALEEVAGCYGQLIKLEQKKRGVLVAIDMKGLEAVTQQEKSVLEQIRRAEEKRKQALLKLTMTDPKLRPDMRMVETYLRCPSSKTRLLLQKLHTRLTRLTQEAQEAQENNAILLHAALGAVNFQLNRIGGSEVSPAYGGHGQEQVMARKKFDFHA
jgi:flagellar biosynthesis/type III secretory pathway chaperone